MWFVLIVINEEECRGLPLAVINHCHQWEGCICRGSFISLQDTRDYTSNSHQISQSTYSLLFFRGQLGYKFTRAVEDTQKNKTAGHKGVSLAAGLRAYLWEHKYSAVFWPWGTLTDGKAEEASRQKLTSPAVLIFENPEDESQSSRWRPCFCELCCALWARNEIKSFWNYWCTVFI